MSLEDCVRIIKKINRNGVQKLEEHKKDFGEVLLHVYAADEIGNPLFELLHNQEENNKVIILCKTIELMWKYGDDSVRNIVDVTLLERLSDDEKVWNHFGRYISEGFIKYINDDLLRSNIAMCGVKPIEI